MKRLVLFLVALFSLMAGQAQNKQGKVLVTYFSATGVTKKAALQLAKVAGGDVAEITPVAAYTDADLDWHDKQSRSSVEMRDVASRPGMKNKIDVSGYSTVYIGFPVWWNLAPRIINTFIESVDLKGKKIVLFATSGGSTISNSVKEIKASYPSLQIVKGKCLNSLSDRELKDFVKSIEEVGS